MLNWNTRARIERAKRIPDGAVALSHGLQWWEEGERHVMYDFHCTSQSVATKTYHGTVCVNGSILLADCDCMDRKTRWADPTQAPIIDGQQACKHGFKVANMLGWKWPA